jgi:hypothetical protein
MPNTVAAGAAALSAAPGDALAEAAADALVVGLAVDEGDPEDEGEEPPLEDDAFTDMTLSRM